ncbi:hypothetical protein ACNSOS_05520 [Aliarcobacter vitoriensis]|uniref:hypothetical protein n=1 Tax=Aliarcobacter vitoriensis TaxID=2011099 RepID=UPI003AAF1090
MNIKNIIIFLIFLFFTACSTTNLNLQNSEFTNIKKQNTFDRCTNFSYISLSDDINYGKIFSEYISLDSSCRWNGLSRGYFVDLFKDTIKSNSFKLVERVEFDNVEVSTYLVDDTSYVNIISKYKVYEDLLIIDYKGIYSTNLIKQFDTSYVNKYLDKPRLDADYFKSLVRMNFINYYFVKESQSFAN